MTHNGHLYGDTVIAMVAEMLNKATDDDAIVGRYGGDEFFVFLKSSRISRELPTELLTMYVRLIFQTIRE